MQADRQADGVERGGRVAWPVAPIAVGLLGVVGMAFAVRFCELIIGNYIAGGVPPISAFFLILVLLGWNSLAGRISRRLAFDRRQILLAYIVMCAGVPLFGSYLIRAWMPHVVALRYWEKHLHDVEGLSQYLPLWIGPRAEKAVTWYYEGTHVRGQIPWGDWAMPLLLWSTFFAALAVSMYCFMVLINRQWVRNERLTFPLLYLPLTLTAAEGSSPVSGMFRRHLFWAGVGVAMVFNALNIAHTIVPSLPAPGFYKPLAPYFTSNVMSPFRSFNLYYMLETIGFGYFIPLEVTFTVWFAYLSIKLLACGGIALGYERPGFPFIHEQCSGAYVACAGFVAWGLRHHMAELWRKLWQRGAAGTSEWVAWLGFLGGLFYMLRFMGMAFVPAVIAGSFLVVLLGFVLVYARIRAETGAPLEFTYPYWKPKDLVVWAFTPAGVMSFGGPRTLVCFGLFSWMSRHHWEMSHAAYDMDALKLSETLHIPRRTLATAVGLAFAVGLAVGLWAHLGAYYEVGTNMASGSLGNGEYRATVALDEFKRTATDMQNLPGRPWDRLGYVGVGFLGAAVMALLRSRIPGFPLHPLGYILATSYGDHNTCIFPLFVAWAVRAAVLRVGGLKAYRKGIPFFVGLIAGHFFFAGVVWPVLSLILGSETAGAYHLFFGG
ncbi:MAG: hypothetical protein HYU66_03540 [Armatimonadetes bacterium]|nr:hypothetical protein [Armatimonadota bacterium]